MPESSERVSTLELFFDLVFVFTVSQVAVIVELHPWSFEAIAQAFVELIAIYWMYGGFAWLTNTFGSAGIRLRIVLLSAMAAFLVVSLAVPRAFGSADLAFGIAYLVLTLVHLTGFWLRGSATFPAMLRLGGTNVIAALLILCASATSGAAHWPFWIVAVLVQIVPALVSRTPAAFAVNVEHFAERHGLMIIIVLGESLVGVALAAQHQHIGAALVIGMLCVLAASAAMWWCYFDGEDDAAARQLARVPESKRGLRALVGYDGSHLLMLAGVIAAAAGSRLSLPDLTAATSTAVAGLIAGGTAVYLLGLAAFRIMIGHAAPWGRLACAAVVLVTMTLGVGVSAAAQLLGVTAVLAAMLAAESWGPARVGRVSRAG
jgi:low temperature requirement protein LtrA